jgi:hypothetical protein
MHEKCPPFARQDLSNSIPGHSSGKGVFFATGRYCG